MGDKTGGNISPKKTGIVIGCIAIVLLLVIGGIWAMFFNKKKPQTAEVSFSSFDGGGYNYCLVMDTDIVTCESEKKYRNKDHDKMTGSGYDVIYTFSGKKQGETTVVIEARSPIIEPKNYTYKLTVDADLNVKAEFVKEEVVEG